MHLTPLLLNFGRENNYFEFPDLSREIKLAVKEFSGCAKFLGKKERKKENLSTG